MFRIRIISGFNRFSGSGSGNAEFGPSKMNNYGSAILAAIIIFFLENWSRHAFLYKKNLDVNVEKQIFTSCPIKIKKGRW
jgi:hypothetical protein